MELSKKTSSDSIIGVTNLTLGDFWEWAYSDILSNRNRAVFAEFLVASALGVTQKPRIEWDAVDLRFKDITIEVKSGAYLQSWEQEKLSGIRFDISKKKSWFAETNTSSEEPIRPATCYVFCLFTEKDSEKANVLDVNQWKFFVLPKKVLEDELGDAKTISLKKLESMAEDVCWEGIRGKVLGVVG